MLLQLSESFKLLHLHPLQSPSSFLFCPRHLHPLFLSITSKFRGPCATFPTSLTQPCLSISCFPSRLLQSLHISAQPISSLHLKLHLLRQERFSPSQVKLLQDNPCFLAASLERVSSFVSFLRAKDESGALAIRVLTRSPSILEYKAERLEEKYKFFQDLGLGSLGLQKLLTNMHTPAVVGTAIRTLQKHIEFLQRIGLSKEDILMVITRCPRILCVNTDSKMEATMLFLYHHGLSKHDFLRLVRSYPQVLGYSIDRNLTKKVEFLRGLGLNFPSRRSAKALIVWTTFNCARLLCGWRFLKNQGFSEDDILKMVLQQPEVLKGSEDGIKRKIAYLKNVLLRDLQDVTKFPAYMCLSLENRIIPRFTFLNELEERGQHAKKLSLGYVLTPSDEAFERRLAIGYAKWKAKYQNKQKEDC